MGFCLRGRSIALLVRLVLWTFVFDYYYWSFEKKRKKMECGCDFHVRMAEVHCTCADVDGVA